MVQSSSYHNETLNLTSMFQYLHAIFREGALHRVKEERNVLTIKRRETNWIGNILHRIWLLKHVTEGKKKGREDEEDDVSSY